MTTPEKEQKNPNNPSEVKDSISDEIERSTIDDSKKESETLEQQVKTKIDSDELKRQVEQERY
jgi:hypothetical protein